jgi:hypothetical protein
MTVFVRVISPNGSGGLPYLNYSFYDSAILAQTPTIRAISPEVSEELSFTVRWDNALVAPGGGQLKWRDVQWLDEAEGVWHDWLVRTYASEAMFTGERGHTYRFRARAWQKYPNGAHLYGPYRPQGDTVTTVAGPTLTGVVLDPEEQPVRGATVAVQGTTYTASTDLAGRYLLQLPTVGPWNVVVSHPWWGSPPPVHDLTVGLTETVPLTWTLRPPDDAIINGGLEQGLAGWTIGSAAGAAPAVVDEPVHTGRGALSLAGDPSLALGGGARRLHSESASVNQNVALTSVWDPVMSFWYCPLAVGNRDTGRDTAAVRFNVLLTVVTPGVGAGLPVTATHVLTPNLGVGGWQHVWHHVAARDTLLTGVVTVEFRLSGIGNGVPDTVLVDEVSLGRTAGGPWAIYLPLIRGHR